MAGAQREIAQVIESAASRLMLSGDDSEIDHEFAAAEEQCKALLDRQEDLVFVKRRIAEWKLRLRCDADLAIDAIDSALRELEALGYENVEIEYSMGVYTVDYLIRNNENVRAQSILNNLNQLVSDSDLPSGTVQAWQDEIGVRMRSMSS